MTGTSANCYKDILIWKFSEESKNTKYLQNAMQTCSRAEVSKKSFNFSNLLHNIISKL